MKNRNKNYVIIEGVIGAGKTTLTQMLAESWDGRVVLEQHNDNPFLEDFYKQPDKYAFQTQLFFLLMRHRQQQDEIPQGDLFHEMLVSDYLFEKDKIFAHLTLDNREIQLYERLFPVLQRDVPTPDLVVYLKSQPERLMKNIEFRNRAYERNMSADYITNLNSAYNQFFKHYTASPLLVVDSSKLDFVKNPDDFMYLKDLIWAYE